MEVETCRAISFFAREGGREKMCAIFRPFQIKISAASRTMSEKKKTFVESRRGKKRESAPPCDALESINRYQNGAKNLSAARTSKNRGRLKSHKETEEGGGGGKRGIEFWWPVQNGGSRIFLHPPRIYKMGKRGLSRTSFFSPPPPPRSFSRFFSSPSLPSSLPFLECRGKKDGERRSWPLARQ